MHSCQALAELQPLFFTPHHVYGAGDPSQDQHGQRDTRPLVASTGYHPTAQDLERYERREPRGIWWPELAQKFDWRAVLPQKTDFYAGPVFRMGMLDLFRSVNDPKELGTIYSGTLDASAGDPLKQMWSLYGLMQVYSRFPDPSLRSQIERLLLNYSLKHQPSKRHRTVVRIVQLWLHTYSANWQEKPSRRAHTILDLIQGPSKINFWEHSPVFMNAVLLILCESKKVSTRRRKMVLEHFVAALSQLPEGDMSLFLWHASTVARCRTDSGCLQRLIADAAIRTRLLRAAPFRSRHQVSLLLYTSMGIAYFRRWLAKYPPWGLLSQLLHAEDITTMRRVLRRLDWRCIIPPQTLGSRLSVPQQLKSIIQTILSHPSCPYRAHTFEDPQRVWISLSTPPPETPRMASEYSELIHVVLCLRLHHEQDQEKHGEELTYDLCSEVLSIFRAPYWRSHGRHLTEPMSIVYPPWKGEDTRSRKCF